MRLQLESYKSQIQQKNKKIRTLQKKNSRYLKKISDLKGILKELREKKFVNADHVTHLENLGVGDIFERYSHQSSTDKYPPNLRSFACTLHFYSPKAYEYVRQKFQLCLPHVRTIRRWYEAVDSEPGFTKESFEALKLKVAATDYKLFCNLVVDEMAIRQRIEWDGKQMHGYVDICNSGKKGDCLPEAKEALVFLVTAINGPFKIPVGYFLVDGVTGEQRANLVKQCLELLRETGVEVTSLTFDGCPANLSMAKELGCTFEPGNMKTSFGNTTSQQPIYIFPDPCHMLKLVRNAFEANGSFIDDTQQEIKWIHLKQLNVLQERENLHLANKLRRNHIFFKNQKMKVRLASQLFSNSVADALTFCAELKLVGFEDVDTTVKFLKLINNLFDVLNSRNMAQIRYKKPLCAYNKAQIFDFLAMAENYLMNLKLLNGTLVVNSSRKTGFIGFLTCIKSLKLMFMQLVEKDRKLKYFPAYKISQDHLELLFGQIRSHGGCNTNPTARQFQAVYKKLMIKSELRDVETGNCKALEKVSILTCSSAIKAINSTLEARSREDDEDDINTIYEMAIFDEEVDVLVGNLSEFSVQTISYIAGFVVHGLIKRLKCDTCISALLADSTDDSNNKFIKLKDKGGLVYPSTDVVVICRNLEVVIKSTILTKDQIVVSSKNLKELLICKSLRRFIGMNLFKNYDFHQFDQSPLDNHIILLTKSIMERYINIRLHYLTKNAMPKLSKRQVLNKYLHFSGQ